MAELQWTDTKYWDGFDAWVATHMNVAFAICAVYLVVIFSIQHIMKDRKAFELQLPLALWNIALAAFSIVGTYFVLPSMWSVIKEKGVVYDLCTTDSEWLTPWVMFFCMSKVPELIDTLFIVLRKRPLRFLHYYHHVVTLLFCWHAWVSRAEHGAWFAAMNLVVHSIMYSYYAFAAFKIRFPNWFRQTITTLQILQMFAGLAIVIHNGLNCNTDRVNIIFGLAMYFSYVILFVQLFVKSYIQKPEGKAGGSGGKKETKKKAKKVD